MDDKPRRVRAGLLEILHLMDYVPVGAGRARDLCATIRALA